MKNHYMIKDGSVAYGKNDHGLFGTYEFSQVTCNVCKHTKVYKDVAFSNKRNPVPVAKKGSFAKDYWRKYIESLPGRNSLPRGF